jgi:voltage-gated potassium channel
MPARYEDLPKATRRRLLRRAFLRPTLTTGGLLLLYFGLPLDGQFSVLTLVALLGGLLAFAGLVAFQARAIIRSPYPRLTAFEALAISVPLFVLLFAVVYFLMAGSQPDAFAEPLTRLDALYFTVTVLTTVGFGDIVARTELARALATIQMLGDLLLLGLGARVLIGAAQSGLASRPGPSADESPAQAPTGDEGQRPP